MDPHPSQRDPGRSSAYLSDSTPGAPGAPGDGVRSRDAPDGGGPRATDRRPRHAGAFTVIPPNESLRSKIMTDALKEEEARQRWKEANRVTCVHLDPERLGGNATLAEAREKQFTDLRCAKLQKKLKKKELDERARREEEEKFQKKKDEQREKAERLQERARREERSRSRQLLQDHLRKTDSFLQRLESRAPAPPASSGATHTSSGSEAAGSAQRGKELKSLQLDHKRVNSAFLDKLEGRGRESEKGEGVLQAERPSSASEHFRQQRGDAPGQQVSLAHLSAHPQQSCSDWTQEADPEPDYDWALMKLMNSFPDCSRVFLEDILEQCRGEYEQAYALLASLS